MSLDRERVAQYPLTVRCRDSGTEPRTTDLALVVNVLDVNDNSPVFSSQTYRGTLIENNYIGMSILQVTGCCVFEEIVERFESLYMLSDSSASSEVAFRT